MLAVRRSSRERRSRVLFAPTPKYFLAEESRDRSRGILQSINVAEASASTESSRPEDAQNFLPLPSRLSARCILLVRYDPAE